MAGSLILFAFFIIIYIVISDIITVLFRLTGLTEEKARFQVVSLLTNSGFTTKESESIVSSKIRRRLAMMTMLFGYAFTVTIVATAVSLFMNLSESEIQYFLFIIPLIIVVLTGFHVMRKSAFFKSRFDRWIENMGNRIMFGKNSNPVVMVDDYGEMVVAQIYLKNVPPILENVPLSQSSIMADHKIMVMMVKNKEGDAKQANADTILKKDDIIIVLGKRKDIREVFEKVSDR